MHISGFAREAMLNQPIRSIMSDEEYQQQADYRQRANAGEKVQFEHSMIIAEQPRILYVEFIPFIDVTAATTASTVLPRTSPASGKLNRSCGRKSAMCANSPSARR